MQSSIIDDSSIPATRNPPPFFAVLVVAVAVVGGAGVCVWGGGGEGRGVILKKASFLLRGYKHQFNLGGIHCIDLFIDFVVLI